MTIRIYCPACRTPFDVDDSLVGEKGLCPSCRTKFTIRKPEAPPTGNTQPLGIGLGGLAGAVPPEARPCGLAVTMALMVMGAYGGAMVGLFQAFPAGSTPPKELAILGMSHPMLLHLPIGMLLGAVVLDFCGGRGRAHSGAVTWLLWLTLLGGSLTAVAGYFLGIKGGYDQEYFTWHMWSGIAVPLAAGLTLITKLIHDSKPAMSSALYRLPLLGTATAIFVAGHFGGEMSHGFDVPGQIKSLFVADQTTTAPLEEQTVYEAIIAPILADKCVSCHGDKKQKGDLRMDSMEALVKAGESGNASVVPGKSAESESIKRILLAADHDDRMPPDGKKQLTAEEVEVLKWWVDSGAKSDVKVKDANMPPALKAKFLARAAAFSPGVLAQEAAPAPAPAAEAPAPAPAPVPAPAPAPAPVDDKVKALEKELGIVLLPVAQNDPALTFNCVNVADKFGDVELAKLSAVADRLVDLNLSRSKISDAAAATLAGMKNLRRLNLANTGVTDAAADQIAALAGLEYLNLVGTKVTDAAMPKFEKIAALKKLYVWQTGVTKPAAEALHGKLPAITINLGWDSEVKTAMAPAPAPAATPAPAPAGGPLDPEKPVYAGLIEPIFVAKCTSCHGDKKQKGKLAMHTLELLMKGGDSGEASVVAGKSGESLIMKRIHLPKDDDDHMPPSDKDQLTEKEVKILKWWIDTGLKNDVKIKDSGLPEDLK